MATISESLKGINSYPIPSKTILGVTLRRGLVDSAEVTRAIMLSKGYRLAEADLFKWLSKAPVVSEGGVSFSFSQKERESFTKEADSIYSEFGEPTINDTYGYIGEDL